MKEYKVLIEAIVSSDLSLKDLKRQLVISLWDENGKKQSDGDSDNLRVIDYQTTDIF